MENLHKMSNLPLKSDYEKERNIESYLTKIQQKSKGTVKNIENYLNRFNRYLVETYDKPNETVLSEILVYSEDKRYRAIFDILQDYVNYLSAKKNHLGCSSAFFLSSPLQGYVVLKINTLIISKSKFTPLIN